MQLQVIEAREGRTVGAVLDDGHSSHGRWRLQASSTHAVVSDAPGSRWLLISSLLYQLLVIFSELLGWQRRIGMHRVRTISPDCLHIAKCVIVSELLGC